MHSLASGRKTLPVHEVETKMVKRVKMVEADANVLRAIQKHLAASKNKTEKGMADYLKLLIEDIEAAAEGPEEEFRAGVRQVVAEKARNGVKA